MNMTDRVKMIDRAIASADPGYIERKIQKEQKEQEQEKVREQEQKKELKFIYSEIISKKAHEYAPKLLDEFCLVSSQFLNREAIEKHVVKTIIDGFTKIYCNEKVMDMKYILSKSYEEHQKNMKKYTGMYVELDNVSRNIINSVIGVNQFPKNYEKWSGYFSVSYDKAMSEMYYAMLDSIVKLDTDIFLSGAKEYCRRKVEKYLISDLANIVKEYYH